MRSLHQRPHRHASDSVLDRPRDGRGDCRQPARSHRRFRRCRHACVRISDRPLRQPVAALHLLRSARLIASLAAIRLREPAVRPDSVHRLLRTGLGRDRSADRANRTPGFRTAKLCHRVRVDLRGASARRCLDRLRRRRGEDLLRRLPARVHDLRPALPRGGRTGPPHRSRAARTSGGANSRHIGGGARLLLSHTRRLTVAACVVVGAALVPQAALAHAQLVQSVPAPNARLLTLPPAVTLIFTEPVTPAGAGIRVFSPSGRQLAGATSAKGSVLSAALVSGELGTYIVSWQVLAADTHPSRGAFGFVVGHPSANPYSALAGAPEIGTATPLGLALQALARWVHFAGFALAFGADAYGVLTKRNQGFNRVIGTGIALLVAAEPLALLSQLASLSFGGDEEGDAGPDHPIEALIAFCEDAIGDRAEGQRESREVNPSGESLQRQPERSCGSDLRSARQR